MLIFLLVLIAAGMSACMDDDELWTFDRMDIPSSSGVFITNEGNFMYGNASLSFYDIDAMQMYNDVFYETNALPLGDVAQSMAIRDSLGYVVLNNSGKINVFNINTFEYVGKITGLTSPRSIHFISKRKAYVTDLYAKRIWIIDPLGRYEETGIIDGEVTGYIDVDNQSTDFLQHSTDEMVQYGKYVFTNCWSYDNKILVIDSEADALVDSIEVGKQPASLVIDRYDKIWAITDGGYQGNPYGHEAPSLIRIDAETREIERTIYFDKKYSPSEVKLNGTRDILYFIKNDIYRMPVLDTIPEVFIESFYDDNHWGGFAALGVEPSSGDVYVADALDNVQPGVVYRYRANGTPVDSSKVGIIPGGFNFLP